MKQFQRLLLASALAAITFTTGCKQQPGGQLPPAAQPAAARAPAIDPAAIARADAQISQPAWLRERLPEHTAAYARIPSLWGTLSAPDGRPLDAALVADQHVKIIAALRKAAQTDPTLAQTEAGPVAQLLLGDQAAPIELAVIDASDGVSPFSRALITTVLDVPDIAALNARIAALSAGNPSPLQAPLDANGDASLQQYGALHFDVSNHRLYLTIGTTASALTLQQDMEQLKTTRPHPMPVAEREIDTSGQGLFVWMSMKGLNSQLEAKLQDQPPGGLLRDALEHMQSVALGWGTIDGRGRLQLQVQAPQARLLGYLATNAGNVDLKSSGKPDWVLTVAEPDAADVHAIHDHLDQDFGAGTGAQIDTQLAQLKAKTGVDLIATQGLFGPHALMFSDANGFFKAIRVRDRKALYATIDDLSRRYGWKLSVTTTAGAEIHSLRIPAPDVANDANGTDPKVAAELRLLSRYGTTHLYWIEDGDYLVFAGVPQLLVDRVASRPDVSIGGWLHDNQAYDSAHTLFGYTGTTHNLQREVYYTYLDLLQMAGDMLGQSVDLTGLPSAAQLKLPTEGVAGLALVANDQRLALQVNYEQSPAETALGGGNSTMTTVAVIGILAAVAIPAYQDYVIRSQVSEGAALAEGAKTAVAEYYSNNGHLPHDNAQAGIASPTSISGNYVSSVAVADGRIFVTYGGPQANQALKGGTLVFAPDAAPDGVKWSCGTAAGSSIDVKYRPTMCRP